MIACKLVQRYASLIQVPNFSQRQLASASALRTLAHMSQVLSSPLIRILPEQLANQIAAGEVVERPASVIKELIENSLDAGATQIDIDVEEGGIKKIRVRDNGCGIHQEQLALAVCRHATSKIESVDDLQAIDSLGFRGEALASIGSVSRMQLISHSADEDCAWCLSSRNGVDMQIEPVAHPVGTSLEVCDLFYNTPARRKFLRTDRTEFRHLDEVFRRMALGRFDVGFQLKHNQRVVHQLHATQDDESRLRRLHKLFGKTFVQQSSYLDMTASGLRLRGWLSQPEYLRSQADQQYFYVNGRIIRDRIINHAIRQAYQQWLYPGRQPAYVLHLELDEAMVDVNVHPTKHEVRFRESRLVHDFISKVVNDALSQKRQVTSDHTAQDEKVTYGRLTPDTFQPQASARSSIKEQTHAYRVPSTIPTVAQEKTPLGIWLGEIQKKFWLFQQEQGLVLLDLERAREQVFGQRLSIAERPLQRQPVLVPINLTLTTAQLQLVEQHQKQLQDWGIELRITGPLTAMVLHMPGLLRGVDVEKFTMALLTDCLSSVHYDQKQFAHLAAIHFRSDSKAENKDKWLEEVVNLPSSSPLVWRLIPNERLVDLVQRG